MKELSFWLNANKIALNVAKTEVILFKTKHKPCDTDLRLKLSRKRLYKTKYLRYLGIKIDENLNLFRKLFHSHLNYVCIAWRLTRYPQEKVSILQKKH